MWEKYSERSNTTADVKKHKKQKIIIIIIIMKMKKHPINRTKLINCVVHRKQFFN